MFKYIVKLICSILRMPLNAVQVLQKIVQNVYMYIVAKFDIRLIEIIIGLILWIFIFVLFIFLK